MGETIVKCGLSKRTACPCQIPRIKRNRWRLNNTGILVVTAIGNVSVPVFA